MKVSFVFVAALAGLASATPAPQEKRDCPFLVDKALSGSVIALKTGLSGFAPSSLTDATDAGAYCFKKTIGCPVDGDLPPPNTDDIPPLECETGFISLALKGAVAALKTGLGPFVPSDYQVGVDAGLVCFKEHLGCAPATPSA